MTTQQSWAVCQVFSKRAPRLVQEAQDIDCGTFLPVYKRERYQDGKLSRNTRQLMPGYLFVKLGPEDRGRVAELDGVYRILPGAERALARLDAELAPLQFAALSGEFNEIERPADPVRRPRRRRRPRAGKRFRMRQQGAAA